MDVNKIQLDIWLKKIKDILEESRCVLQEVKYSKVADLPQSVSDSEGKSISIVFAGQYSAGKSSILKTLTGMDDIKIGAAITTQTVREFDWNGIKIIDTPGIKNGINMDHDEIAYKAINEADMLIYVVTENLFDNYIAEDFRRLLIDHNKAKEMMLFVNKMGNNGNSVEIRKIKENDLKRVMHPYENAVKIVFIDAKDYLDSVSLGNEADDEEIKKALYERSNYAGMVRAVNEFVHEKGMTAKLTTPLQQVGYALEDAIVELNKEIGNPGIEMLIEKMRQEKKTLDDNRREVESDINLIIAEHSSQIRDLGRQVSDAVSKATSEGDVKQIVDTAYDKVDTISDDCGKCIEEKFSKGITELGKSLESLENNPNFKRIELSLTENGEDSPIVRYILKEDLISNIGTRLAENTVNKNNIATGLETFSGSEVHDVLIKLGGKLGKKFKPWEAVKLTKKINYLAKGLTIASVIFSVALQIKDDVDRENAEQEMRENRRKIRTTFNEVANEMETYFKNTVKNEITDSYLTSIRSIDENIGEILRLEGNKKIEVDRLKTENQACKNLISEIQEYAVE